jgi:hypothetical protein
MPTHKPRRSRQPSEWARQKHSAKPSVILRQLRKLPIRFGRVFFINRFSVFVVVFRVCQKPQCKDVLLVKVNGGNGAKPLTGDVENEHRPTAARSHSIHRCKRAADIHKPLPFGGFYDCQPTLKGGSSGRMPSRSLRSPSGGFTTRKMSTKKSYFLACLVKRAA